MGTTYTNLQVKTEAQDAVVEALMHPLKEPAYVSPSVGGWVGVYPEGRITDITELARQLSVAVSYPAMALMVHDSDVFLYWLYKNGEPRDEFNSDPDWGTDVDDEHSPPPDVSEKMRVSGSPEALLPYCLSGVTSDQIRGVLHPAEASQAAKERLTFSAVSADQYLFADAQAADLTKLLGMDETLASLGYEYIEAGETKDYTLGQFLLIKTDITD